MGCEQCKLSDVSDADSNDNVIENVAVSQPPQAAESAIDCNICITAEDEPPDIECLDVSNCNTAPSVEDMNTDAIVMVEDEVASSVPDNDTNVGRSLLDVQQTVDSNILDSTERLEADDEVFELNNISDDIVETSNVTPTIDDNDSGSYEVQDSESEPNNDNPTHSTRSSDAVAEGDTSVQPNEKPSPKSPRQRTTVRINSIRGHKVTRKLSINPGDEVISQHPTTFVQLSGHEGHFHVAGPGSIWKQQAKDGEVEAKVLKELNEDSLHAYVPDFMGEKEHNGKKYIGMEDLMSHFADGCGMDIKMGTRTFKESEVKNQTLRSDLYEKMVNLDPREPSEQEHRDRGITKLRYMTFRERESSSQTLGFRIEAMKIKDGAPNKDFKKLKHKQEVKNALKIYFNPLSKSGVEGFIAELTNLNGLLKESTFFKEHEFIGTSLLFIYDDHKVGVWLIDFGKTTAIRDCVPGGMITHEKDWELGNYEDGYFTGMTSVIQILTEIYEEKVEDVAELTTIRVH